MSEQAKLPAGVERFLVAVCPKHGHRKCAAGRVGLSLGCDRDTEVVETVRLSDLPTIIAQRDSEWRSGILGDEAAGAAYLSLDGEQLKWLASAPLGRKEIARTALQAAIDKGAPDGGRE